MNRIDDILKRMDVLPNTQIKVSYRPGVAEMTLLGGRKQTVYIERGGGRYMLTSRVLGKQRVENFYEKYSERGLALTVWNRNNHSGVVEFAFDDAGRLVGRIAQVRETLDREELLFYLQRLAQECDRFEYLLTGKDQM